MNYKIFAVMAFLISLICGFIIIPVITEFCKKRKLYDIPNERKVHKNAIPRLGGVCFMPSMIISFLLAMAVYYQSIGKENATFSMWSFYFIISLTIIYITGIIDDIIGLDATVKFIAQIIAASLLPLSGLWINNLYGICGIYDIPYIIGAPLTIFVIVFVDNSINLIDGIDGLAAGLSFIALTGFMICFMREGLLLYAILISGLMGVLIPYLYFNLFGSKRNMKIFMGDSGSLTLGFILGFLFIKVTMNKPDVLPFNKESLILAYSLLIIPVFDVVRVIFVRLRHHKPIFQADKNHIHHKLMTLGLSQHKTLITILSMSMLFTAFNLLIFKYISLTLLIVINILLYYTFNILTDFKLHKITATNQK